MISDDQSESKIDITADLGENEDEEKDDSDEMDNP